MTEGSAALVLDGGSGQSLAIARKLGATGWRIMTEAGSRTARSRFTVASVPVPSTDDASRYADWLAATCAQHGIELVVPTNDRTLELCWAASERLGQTRILGGDRAAVETFLDKAAGIAAAERCGFPVPRTLVPETFSDVAAAASEIGFPCVVKPRRSFVHTGSGLTHVRHTVVKSLQEAEAAAEELRRVGAEAPLAQALVAGRALAATFVVHEGRVLARAARETLSFWPVTGGTSVWKRALPLDTPGVAEAERFLLAFGLEGLAEVEYQLDEAGRVHLMEVGPRAHGWIPLAEVSCPGLIEVAAAAATGRPGPELRGYRPGIEMRWLRGELLRARVAVGLAGRLPPTVSRRALFRAAWPPWKPGMRYDIIDLADPRPWAPRPLAMLLRRR